MDKLVRLIRVLSFILFPGVAFAEPCGLTEAGQVTVWDNVVEFITISNPQLGRDCIFEGSGLGLDYLQDNEACTIIIECIKESGGSFVEVGAWQVTFNPATYEVLEADDKL